MKRSLYILLILVIANITLALAQAPGSKVSKEFTDTPKQVTSSALAKLRYIPVENDVPTKVPTKNAVVQPSKKCTLEIKNFADLNIAVFFNDQLKMSVGKFEDGKLTLVDPSVTVKAVAYYKDGTILLWQRVFGCLEKGTEISWRLHAEDAHIPEKDNK